MEFKDVFSELRKKFGFSQNELAEKLFVTRQAVSRWERGETVPEIETLQAMSQLFGVSINTLLGSPHALVCQSCGMPLGDETFARNQDGTFNEGYCNGAGQTMVLQWIALWKKWWSSVFPICLETLMRHGCI